VNIYAMRKFIFPCVGIGLAVGLFVILRRPDPISTRIPELTSLVEQVRQDTDRAVSAYVPHVPGRIDDLSVSAVALLQQLPGVARVERFVAVDQPAQRIIQVADWHYVAPEFYALDLEHAYGRTLSAPENDQLFRELLLQVELVSSNKWACCAVSHAITA
jgi:hypothetical protein